MKVLESVLDSKCEPAELLDTVRDEVEWQAGITHRGGALPRRFATQALIEPEKIPLYRHPMDGDPVVLPFSPTVDKIRLRLTQLLPAETFNHVIIQEYRSGEDFIAEHADKTLDIAKGSVIVNYSIGETRTMKLRSKDHIDSKYEITDVTLKHDSAFLLDLAMNRKYKHSIRKVMNMVAKPRISLTFRNIATYYEPTEDGARVYGQGAPKLGQKALSVDELLHAWHEENSSSTATWDELYSRGFPFISVNAAVKNEESGRF